MHALLTAAAVAVSLVPALAQQTAATLQVQVGQVSLLKDGNPVALFVGQTIQANQMVITGAGAYAKFRIADGSEFEVFEKSQVTFRDKGGSWTDVLNVWIGHVKVYVQHIFGPNPTSVTSPTAVISVRGTVFDVVVENDDGDTLVSVDDGKVQVRHRLIPGGEPLLLPGQSVRVFRNQPLLGQQIDKSGAAQKVLAAFRKAVIDYIYTRPGGVGGSGGPIPGGGTGTSTGGAQGDKGKNSGGTGGTSGAPAPPAPPGGH
jgi:ferric-dicitrate binding protein FerR (iron transport regulator)